MSDSVWPHRRQPTRLPRPWDSPGKNIGVGCHFLLQCMKVKSESEVTQSCPTLSDPMDCSLPGSSVCGIFQARVLEWGAIVYLNGIYYKHSIYSVLDGLCGSFFCLDGAWAASSPWVPLSPREGGGSQGASRPRLAGCGLDACPALPAGPSLSWVFHWGGVLPEPLSMPWALETCFRWNDHYFLPPC